MGCFISRRFREQSDFLSGRLDEGIRFTNVLPAPYELMVDKRVHCGVPTQHDRKMAHQFSGQTCGGRGVIWAFWLQPSRCSRCTQLGQGFLGIQHKGIYSVKSYERLHGRGVRCPLCEVLKRLSR